MNEGKPWVQASALMDATPTQISKVITDYDHMSQFAPSLAKGRILSRTGHQRKVQLDVSILGFTRSSEVDVIEDVNPARRLHRWERSGGTIPVNHGRWILIPTDDKTTFARYEMESYWGLPIPHWMQRLILIEVLPQMLERLNSRIAYLKNKEPAYFTTPS